MSWILLIICLLIFIPLFTYILSKIQMIGWLNAIKSDLKYQEKIKEEKTNGKEEETFYK